MEILSKPTGIIVADDDPLIRSILKTRLEAIGQEVFQAGNGVEAVALASKVRASLFILDIRMPRLDGVLACAEIRQTPGYLKTPIVMLTFDDSEKAKRLASRAGATMFLVKPFSTATLMLALSTYLPIDEATKQDIQSTALRAAGGKAFAKMRS